MPFGKRRKQETPAKSNAAPARQENATERQADVQPGVSSEKVWLDLASMEQEVAELIQIAATKQEQAARLWESAGDENVRRNVRDIAVRAWALENELLNLVEIALDLAKRELHRV